MPVALRQPQIEVTVESDGQEIVAARCGYMSEAGRAQPSVTPGSSLGGARPKAAVIDASGRLAIAKFPRSGSDDWDIPGWEKLELDLAERAGLAVTRSELAQVGGRHVLVVDRFDRSNGPRTGFTSAPTMLEAADREQRSYLEIAEVIERHSSRATADLRELCRRIVFSILIRQHRDCANRRRLLPATAQRSQVDRFGSGASDIQLATRCRRAWSGRA